MGLRKSHVKKGSPRVYNSGLFGIIDKAKSTNKMRNSEPGFPVVLNFRSRKLVRDATLQAEYRKAQAIALTRQMRYM